MYYVIYITQLGVLQVVSCNVHYILLSEDIDTERDLITRAGATEVEHVLCAIL